jgi:hypothetical protein
VIGVPDEEAGEVPKGFVETHRWRPTRSARSSPSAWRPKALYLISSFDAIDRPHPVVLVDERDVAGVQPAVGVDRCAVASGWLR